MKIAIIGKGASSFGVVLALETKYKFISQVDIYSKKKIITHDKNIFSGNQINNFLKKNIQSLNIPSKINIQTGEVADQELFNETYEQMSLWGASFIPFSKEDIESSGLKWREVITSYNEISKKVPISGNSKDKIEDYYQNTFINESKVEIDDNLHHIIKKCNTNNMYLNFVTGYARLALSVNDNKQFEKCECIINNCVKHNLFSSTEINKYILNSKLKTNFINHDIFKINFENKKIIYNDHNQEKKSKNYDLIFICSGAKSLLSILGNSLNIEKLSISDSSSYLFPLLAINGNIFKKNSYNFSLTSVISKVIHHNLSSKEEYFLQFYKTPEYLWKNLFSSYLWPLNIILSKILSKIIYVGSIYLDNNYVTEYDITYKNNKISYVSHQKEAKGKVSFIIKNLNQKLGKRLIALRYFLFKNKHSHHFGNLKCENFNINEFAKQQSKNGIYFCGSALFNSLPPESPTFTIIAQSHQIAMKCVKKYFS